MKKPKRKLCVGNVGPLLTIYLIADSSLRTPLITLVITHLQHPNARSESSLSSDGCDSNTTCSHAQVAPISTPPASFTSITYGKLYTRRGSPVSQGAVEATNLCLNPKMDALGRYKSSRALTGPPTLCSGNQQRPLVLSHWNGYNRDRGTDQRWSAVSSDWTVRL
jgi:hypothetical protein